MSIELLHGQYHLKTDHTSYVMAMDRGRWPAHLYWGQRLEREMDLQELAEEPTAECRPNGCHVPMDETNRAFLSDMAMECGLVGNGDYRIPSLMVKGENGSTVVELSYTGETVYDGVAPLPGLPSAVADSATQTLELHLEDAMLGLRVTLCYTVFEKQDIIARSMRTENIGKQTLHILSAQSALVDFSGQNYELLHLQGDWARERSIERVPVRHGIFTVDSKRGMSSHAHNPFVALVEKNASESSGRVYGFCLEYSGSFAAQAEGTADGGTRVAMGLNPDAFDWTLAPGDTFTTPQVFLCFAENGLGEMSRRYHAFLRECVTRGPWKMRDRPILVNNWEGTEFAFDEEKLLAIAREGEKIGAEMFVLDDGWFGRRNSDTCSLGDWFVNREKLPHGLDGLSDAVHGMGMKFGIWLEPEMVSPDSELYRAHPDWCVHAEGRTRTLSRHQLVLDLAKPEVQTYVIDAVTAVLGSAKIEYVKWDCNRNLSETPDQMQPHRYMLGLYHVMETLTARFPTVLFESCSGGGGRFDAGMLYYMPQTWTSDNTDSLVRTRVQYGTSLAYPASAMTAHIGSVPAGYEEHNRLMEASAAVAMSGTFGVEMDLTRLTETEKTQLSGYVAKYKAIRHTVQYGTLYRLEDPFACGDSTLEYVGENQVVLFAYQSKCGINGEERRVHLQGLDPAARYTCEGKTRLGEQLMKVGLRILRGNYERDGKCYVFTKEN